MQIVKIPWALIPVSAELDIPETDKLAMVRNQPTNTLKTMLILNLITLSFYFEIYPLLKFHPVLVLF